MSAYLSLANVDNIHSLEELIEFNLKHAAEELPKGQYVESFLHCLALTWFTPDHPDQNWLLKGVHNRPSQEEYESDVAYFQQVAREEGIEKLFREKDLNLLAFSADCLFFEIASAAGKPFLLSSSS